MSASFDERLETDLRSQGGVLTAIMELHDAMQAVASSVRAVAVELDHERRGDLGAGPRQDVATVEKMLRELAAGSLLWHEDDRARLRRVLREIAGGAE